jgi:hypothetical protein
MKMRWVQYAAGMGDKENAYTVLTGKPYGNRLIGRPTYRWQDNIKTDLREIGWGMDWIKLALDMTQLRAIVNTVHSGSIIAGNLLSG